jgi:hypothetical protein
MKKICYSFLVSVLLMACTSNQKVNDLSLKDYFFNYKNLLNSDTVNFVNQNDTNEKAYWVLQSKITGNDTFLVTTILNTKKQLSEEMILTIGANDSKLSKYTLYNDSLISVQCKIMDSTYYQWNQGIGDTISWKVEFPEFSKKGTVQITRKRVLVKLDSTNNKAIFWDSNNMIMKESHLGYNFYIENHFTKGLGLTQYKITDPKGIIKDFKRIE